MKMKEVPFEKALEKLEKIVEDLEAGDLPLDASLKKYEEGIKLARTCQQKLEKAKKKIEVLIKKDE
jgi:exodeoxyribonuclease VII small subunit